jgi:hypothetical protein
LKDFSRVRLYASSVVVFKYVAHLSAHRCSTKYLNIRSSAQKPGDA